MGIPSFSWAASKTDASFPSPPCPKSFQVLSTQTSIGEEVRSKGLVALKHSTSPVNLVGILKRGAISAMSNLRGSKIVVDGRATFVDSIHGSGADQLHRIYLSPVMESELSNGDTIKEAVLLVISPSVLNSKKFYFNNTWNHDLVDFGGDHPFLGRTSYAPSELATFLGSTGPPGEFVFVADHLDISPSSTQLLEVIVSDKIWPKVQQYARENGVDLAQFPIRVGNKFQSEAIAKADLKSDPKLTIGPKLLTDGKEIQQLAEMAELAASSSLESAWLKVESPDTPKPLRNLYLRRILRDLHATESKRETFLNVFRKLRGFDSNEARQASLAAFSEAVYRRKFSNSELRREIPAVLETWVKTDGIVPGLQRTIGPHVSDEQLLWVVKKSLVADIVESRGAIRVLDSLRNGIDLKANSTYQAYIRENLDRVPREVASRWLVGGGEYTLTKENFDHFRRLR